MIAPIGSGPPAPWLLPTASPTARRSMPPGPTRSISEANSADYAPWAPSEVPVLTPPLEAGVTSSTSPEEAEESEDSRFDYPHLHGRNLNWP